MSNDWRDNSSKNRFYNDRYRPSSPIEVPSQRGTTTSFSLSSGNQWSPSSELIFDMSPLSQEYSSMHFDSIAQVQSARTEHERGPFLYQLPIFGSHSYRPTQSDPRPEDFPPPTNNVSTPISTEGYQCTSAAIALETMSPRGETVKKDIAVSASLETTKIVGFSPIIPPQSPGRLEEYEAKKLPFPPPRRMPPTASSWILSGKSEDESPSPRRSSDPVIIDFSKYLLNRMDDKKHRLFRDVMAY